MKINNLYKKYILKKSLGYTFKMYHHKDDNNNECFTLTVMSREFRVKERVLLTNPTYVVGMFDNKIKEYLFKRIEYRMSLIIDSLELNNVLSVERCTNSFKVHRDDSVYYEEVFYDGYEELFAKLQEVVRNYKNYF